MAMTWWRYGAALVLLGAAGCSTTAMKGTPFYTGEYQSPSGPVEDRVNLWPLAYYRDPALSLLWPIGEYVRDEHLAVRPLLSIHDLSKPHGQEINVLWPFFQQDRETGDGRLFPLLWWGDDYFTAFPLYWHEREAAGFHDALIPLWWYERSGTQIRFAAALGLAGFSRSPGLDSWWVAPLAGSLRGEGDARYRFLLWPILHDAQSRLSQWRAILPLWSSYDGPGRWNRMALGLWWQGGSTYGSDWQTLLPLYARIEGSNEDGFFTLLGGRHRKGHDTRWLIPPLLSAGHRSPESEKAFLFAGLAGWRQERDRSASHLVPLYARTKTPERDQFISLLWSSVQEPDGSGWSASPLHFRRTDEEGRLTVSPLYLSGSDTVAHRDWLAVPPLFYRSRDGDHRRFVTLLGGWDTGPSGRATTIYPLLSRYADEGDAQDWWLLAPLAHLRLERGEHRQSHLLPLYYRDTARDLTLSPVYAGWGDDRDRLRIVPPLLSWRHEQDRRDDCWIAAGLGHLSLGEQAGSSHILPLFYRDPAIGTLLSPIYCSWERGPESHTLIPPLLSGRSRRGDETDLWGLGGAISLTRCDRQTTAHRVLPFYAWSRDAYFYTPLAGASEDGFRYYCTPLVHRKRTADEDAFRILPLFSREVRSDGERYTRLLWGRTTTRPGYRRSIFFPFFGYTRRSEPGADYEKDFFSLPICWYRDRVLTDSDGNEQSTMEHGVFPLWSHQVERTDGVLTYSEQSVLLFLYDHRLAQRQTNEPASIRHRVLWRLWHYERTKEGVSVDVIPAITWDARVDGYRQFSFLWRAFRWEKKPNGRHAIDLLFCPVVRTPPERSTDTRN